MRWAQALELAGLRAPTPTRPPAAGRRLPRASGANGGLPIAQAVAHYAALNRAWPSYPTLMAWARDSGFAMQVRPSGGCKPVVAAARVLLVDPSIEPLPGDGPKPVARRKPLRPARRLREAPRPRARAANTAERRDHGTPVADATRLRAERLRNRLAGDEAPVAFRDAVRAVLAAGAKNGQPPLSS